MPDPILDHVLKIIDQARDRMRAAAARIGEATGPEFGSGEHIAAATLLIGESAILIRRAVDFAAL